ncbi:unnamed protein product [Anisakis simplex]|uniref:Secreted protein n=1 Tax=Anisakis simplex TaxID=6269 RepID=A0A0M3JHY4_ANISI|nr:unnamed protein product [Anisakis simplex]
MLTLFDESTDCFLVPLFVALDLVSAPLFASNFSDASSPPKPSTSDTALLPRPRFSDITPKFLRLPVKGSVFEFVSDLVLRVKVELFGGARLSPLFSLGFNSCCFLGLDDVETFLLRLDFSGDDFFLEIDGGVVAEGILTETAFWDDELRRAYFWGLLEEDGGDEVLFFDELGGFVVVGDLAEPRRELKFGRDIQLNKFNPAT